MSERDRRPPLSAYASAEHLRQLEVLIGRLEVATMRAQSIADRLSGIELAPDNPHVADQSVAVYHSGPIQADDRTAPPDTAGSNRIQMIVGFAVGAIALIITYIIFFGQRS